MALRRLLHKLTSPVKRMDPGNQSKRTENIGGSERATVVNECLLQINLDKNYADLQRAGIT